MTTCRFHAFSRQFSFDAAPADPHDGYYPIFRKAFAGDA